MPVTAEQLLMSGVTSIRDLGAPIEILNVKKRIDSGQAIGPTIYASGPFLTDAPFGPHSVAVSDEAAARAATKKLIAAGVSVIKFVSADRMAPDAARAIVEEAHAAGLKTTAHGRTDPEIHAALAAGVDEFQHIGTQSPEYPEDIVSSIRQRVRQGPPLSWSPTVGPDLNADDLAANPDTSMTRGTIADFLRSSQPIFARRSPKRRYALQRRKPQRSCSARSLNCVNLASSSCSAAMKGRSVSRHRKGPGVNSMRGCEASVSIQ